MVKVLAPTRMFFPVQFVGTRVWLHCTTGKKTRKKDHNEEHKLFQAPRSMLQTWMDVLRDMKPGQTFTNEHKVCFIIPRILPRLTLSKGSVWTWSVNVRSTQCNVKGRPRNVTQLGPLFSFMNIRQVALRSIVGTFFRTRKLPKVDDGPTSV